MSIFDSWILQAILINEAFDSLQKFDKEDSDSDMQEITHCPDCEHWKRDGDSNNGNCAEMHKTMYEDDFCSRAKPKRHKNSGVEFTDNEKETALFLDRMDIYKIRYNAEDGVFTLIDIYGVTQWQTKKPVFPTIKNDIGKSCEFVLDDISKK